MLATARRKAAGSAAAGFRRMVHATRQPAPLGTAIDHHQTNTSLPPLAFPEIHDDGNVGAEFSSFPFSGGAMELMAVPKKKTTPHKKVLETDQRL